MEPVQYLRALRQWWYLIVGLTLLGVLAAFLTYSAPETSFTATHTLVQEKEDTRPVDLARAAFQVTTGAVPGQVAAALGEPRAGITGGVTAIADGELNGLRISAVGGTAERARTVADTYSEELTKVLDEQSAAQYDAQVKAANAAVDSAAAALSAAGFNAPDALRQRYDSALRDLQEIQAQAASSGSGLVTLGDTSVSAESTGTGRGVRVAVGGFLGLLLGVLAALVLARFDTRIRTRDSAEENFGAPVLAEIPPLKRRHKAYSIITRTDPESLSAEAYRGLRTALLVAHNSARRAAVPPIKRRRRTGAEQPTRDSRVVMVVSPGQAEGKTTTTANLAVAFAETGQRVLVLGLDLRRPELHNYFGVAERPGLTEVLAGGGRLEDVVVETIFDGVSIAPSGQPVDHPGELISRGMELIGHARDLADVVIVDTAPLLATDDASLLVPIVDDVVLVCKVGRTPNDAAVRTRELLERLEAPVAGVTLVGAQQLATSRSYYRSDYRSRTSGVDRLTFPEPTKATTIQPKADPPAGRMERNSAPVSGHGSVAGSSEPAVEVDEPTSDDDVEGGASVADPAATGD